MGKARLLAGLFSLSNLIVADGMELIGKFAIYIWLVFMELDEWGLDTRFCWGFGERIFLLLLFRFFRGTEEGCYGTAEAVPLSKTGGRRCL
jgi:hypothetical protein